MKRMLRKRDLVEALGVAKSTVADWVIEFQVYIPTVRQGSVTYYLPEAIDVLNVIRELREQDYAKPDIMRMLGERGFPITIVEAVEDVQRVVDKADYRDGFLKIMQNVGESIARVTEQTQRIDRHEERMDGQDGRIAELEQQLESLRTELAAAKEQQDRRKWYQFFKR
jgi:DNA-binding transcriptional MerR regulator